MLYLFARIVMTTGLRFFYRHLHVSGLNNIPAQGPVIIVANHHSSLMDAAMLGILLKRKAYYFARGDVFANPIVKKILWWLHMLPVHQHEYGRHTIGANDESFFAGQKILAANGLIVYFPESISHIEHRLLDFRKGVFRLAFTTLSQLPEGTDIAIVPAGIVYDHHKHCRQDAQIHIGTATSLKTYLSEWRTKPAAALLHISRDMRVEVKELMLHIVEHERCNSANQLLELSRNANDLHRRNWVIHSNNKLQKEQAICVNINKMDEQAWEENKARLKNYFQSLSRNRINDQIVSEGNSGLYNQVWVLWMGYPLYLAGLICHGLPLLIARSIVEKKVYRPDFYSWIFVACYSLLYLFWLSAWLIIAVAIGGWYGLIAFLLSICAGLFALSWRRKMEQARAARNWRQLAQTERERLKQQRASLV